MAITVQEALLLPVMKKAKLLAGEKGISKQIKWVTIVEVIEDITRFQEGDFLITTGYGLNEKDEHFCELLQSGILSGIAFYSGFYVQNIPPNFLKIASEQNLPFIELPTDINFSEITKGILEEIVNKQMEMTLFSLETHKQLTKLVLKNDGPNKISATLAKFIRSSIFVLNEYDELTQHIVKEQDLQYKEKHIFYNDHSLPIFPFIQSCREKMSSVEMDWMHLKIVVQPIIANEKFFGSLVIVANKEEWLDIYFTTLEHGATVYAIEYLKEEAVKQTQMRLQGEFLEEVINKFHQETSLIKERGKAFGYNFSIYQAVLQLKLLEEEDSLLNEQIEKLYYSCSQIMKKNKRQYMISTKLDGLTVLFEVKADKKKNYKKDTLKIAQQILKNWGNHHLLIGVGKVYKEPESLSDSAREARYAVELAHLLHSHNNVVHYDDLATYHLLIEMKERGFDLKSFYEQQLNGLITTSKHGTDYIQTLEYYFKYNLNMQATAQSLFIHRHTLKYRLEQIEKRSGFNLSSADDRLKLQLAIAAYKLDRHFES